MMKSVYLISAWSLGSPQVQHFLFYDRKSAVKKVRLLICDPLVDSVDFVKQFMEVEK